MLLVTGGNGDSDRLDSTEILEDTTWKTTAPLPSARNSLKAASIDNKILVFGRNIFVFMILTLFIIILNIICLSYHMHHSVTSKQLSFPSDHIDQLEISIRS